MRAPSPGCCEYIHIANILATIWNRCDGAQFVKIWLGIYIASTKIIAWRDHLFCWPPCYQPWRSSSFLYSRACRGVVQLTKVWLWTDSFVNPLMCTTWRYVSSPNHGITGENHPRRVYRRPEFETHFEGRCVVPCAMAMHRWLSLFTNIILLYTFISNKPHWTCHCHNYWGGRRFCPHRCLQHRKLQRIRCQVNWQVWDQYLINKGIDGPHRVRDRLRSMNEIVYVESNEKVQADNCTLQTVATWVS